MHEECGRRSLAICKTGCPKGGAVIVTNAIDYAEGKPFGLQAIIRTGKLTHTNSTGEVQSFRRFVSAPALSYPLFLKFKKAGVAFPAPPEK